MTQETTRSTQHVSTLETQAVGYGYDVGILTKKNRSLRDHPARGTTGTPQSCNEATGKWSRSTTQFDHRTTKLWDESYERWSFPRLSRDTKPSNFPGRLWEKNACRYVGFGNYCWVRKMSSNSDIDEETVQVCHPQIMWVQPGIKSISESGRGFLATKKRDRDFIEWELAASSVCIYIYITLRYTVATHDIKWVTKMHHFPMQTWDSWDSWLPTWIDEVDARGCWMFLIHHSTLDRSYLAHCFAIRHQLWRKSHLSSSESIGRAISASSVGSVHILAHTRLLARWCYPMQQSSRLFYTSNAIQHDKKA